MNRLVTDKNPVSESGPDVIRDIWKNRGVKPQILVSGPRHIKDASLVFGSQNLFHPDVEQVAFGLAFILKAELRSNFRRANSKPKFFCSLAYLAICRPFFEAELFGRYNDEFNFYFSGRDGKNWPVIHIFRYQNTVSSDRHAAAGFFQRLTEFVAIFETGAELDGTPGLKFRRIVSLVSLFLDFGIVSVAGFYSYCAQ